MAEAVRLDAPAKVNLRLSILAREESGFHGLETVFCALGLADVVEVRRAAPGIALAVHGGVDTGPPERNLVVRAAERFHQVLGAEPAVAIRLEKRIPSAAGLGGGSSDAAATLRALNVLHDEPFPRAILLQLAIELGSDVPFFLCGSPLALGWSRGERLLALPPLPERPVLVAHPGVAMPTPEAFRRVAEARGEYHPQAHAIDLRALASWQGVAALAENDFERDAVEAVPLLEDVRRVMLQARAEVAMLSGSGASYFGVFTDTSYRDSAAAELADLGVATWRTETRTQEPAPWVDFAGGRG